MRKKKLKTGELIEHFQQLLRLNHWSINWLEVEGELPGCYATVMFEDGPAELSAQKALIIFENGHSVNPKTVGHEVVHLFLIELGIDLPEKVEEALVDRITAFLLVILQERGILE